MAEVNLDSLAEALGSLPENQSNLIPALQLAQSLYGYLPRPAMVRIAESFGLPLGRVYGVATFYSQFRLKPQGEVNIRVCQGTACHVRGSDRILTELRSELGISPGDSTDDGRFSLERVACLGACGLAPVVVVGGEAHGRVEAKTVLGLLPKPPESA